MSAEALADPPVEPDLPDPRAHPAPEQLERFMRGELSAEERSAIVRHLLTGCPQCRYIAGRLWSLGEEETLSTKALLKKKVRSYRRQTREKASARPRKRGAAVTVLTRAVQELKATYRRLEGIAGALPPTRPTDSEADDVVWELHCMIRGTSGRNGGSS